MPNAYPSKKVIYGDDSSSLISSAKYNALPEYVREVVDRSVVFVRKNDVEILSDGRLKIKKISHKDLTPELPGKEKIKFCDDFNNLTKQNIKLNKGQFCSGFLDSNSVVHSAGHCFSNGMTCNDYYILRNAKEEKTIFEKNEFRQCMQSESNIDTNLQTKGSAPDQKPNVLYQNDNSDKALLMLKEPFNTDFEEVSVRVSSAIDISKDHLLTTICGSNGFPLHSLTGKVFTVNNRVPSWSSKNKNIKTVISNMDLGAGCSGGGVVSFDHENKTFRLEAVNSFTRAPEPSLQFPIGSQITVQKNKKKICISSEKYREQAVSNSQNCSGDLLDIKIVSENKNTLIKKIVGIKKKGKKSSCWSGTAGYSTQNYVDALTRIRQRAKVLHRINSPNTSKKRGAN